ncbi:UNVERIFIED_CONTAM: hypothetical protein Sradi_5416700 [Sesamum radiatum]|uniref:Uncharacterized protein n=1 Tax=Sesamum radiatum TaxID=300843 RepID=A0AAW2LAM3_SESRA
MSAIISSRRLMRSSTVGFGGGGVSEDVDGDGDGDGDGDLYVQLETRPHNQGRIHDPCSCPRLQPATSAAGSLPPMPPIQ